MADDDGTNPVPTPPTNINTSRRSTQVEVDTHGREEPTIVADIFARDTGDAGICVADGYGLRITVERAHLVVADGIGRHRRTRRYARATHGLRRLVILGHTGSVSLETLAWCRRLGIEIAIVDTDATVQFTSVPNGIDDARLRRRQAATMGTQLGLVITRELLTAKLSGQASLVRRRFNNDAVADAIHDLCEALADTSDIDQARQLEASAAALYWNAWTGRDDTAPRFATRDQHRVPTHWTTFEGRRSVLASAHANRRAERPTNAIINYCNALAEIETVLACHVVGLDPGLGVLHRDARDRHSLAQDLLEPIRPAIEGVVLDLLSKRTFRYSDFSEGPDGHVRVLAPLTHELAEMMPRWSRAVAPIVERTAHRIGAALDGGYDATTRLTGARQRAGQARAKARALQVAASPVPVRRQRAKSDAAMLLFATCVVCGGPVERKGHVRCQTCRSIARVQDEATRRKRGRAIAASRAELERWRREHPEPRPDPEVFRRDILPGLANVKLSEIVTACGVARSWASMIRSGRKVPALRHWAALADLARRRAR
jgi:CRISPR-associated endonuclease Cas1